MSETVYLLGAGINRVIKDPQGFQPPLATDLFQLVLNQNRYTENPFLLQKLQPLFDYIERYWKFSVEQLKNYPFNLEECYTLIQLQEIDAEIRKDTENLVFLSRIELQLTILLASYLANFRFSYNSETFRIFGKIIYDEKAVVLTFNYDTILESVIQGASQVNINLPATFSNPTFTGLELPDDEVSYSHFNWNFPLAYGIKFDEVQLRRAGNSTFISSERFYSHPENKLYDTLFLKLHGSINWFSYSGIKKYPAELIKRLGVEKYFPNNENEKSKAGQTILFDGSWWNNELPELGEEILQPIIITPVLHKNLHKNSFINEIWELALKELSSCKTLVVGGYSFPPTDFNTKRLFLEAFINNSPEEIIVINPDTSVVQIIKDLCHFKKPVLVCRDLDEFVSLYEKG